MGASCVKAQHHSEKLTTRRMGNFTFQEFRMDQTGHQRTGRGCKETPAWRTEATRQDLILKREEFWDTRTQGDPAVWRTLRMACEAEDPCKA